MDSYELEYMYEKEAAATPADRPRPWRSMAELGGAGRVAGGGRPRPRFIMSGLDPGHRYRVRVRALAFSGWTDWSQPSAPLKTDRRF